jgi:Flp pilus assembly protein TadG
MKRMPCRPSWLQALPGRLRGVRHWRDTDAGQTLVEFSLVIPIFLVMVFALVDFGRAFYTWLVVTNAAREGARAAAVQGDAAAIDSKLYGSFCSAWPSPSGCSLDTTKMTVTKTNVQGPRGSEARVAISYNFTFVTPIGPMLALVGGSSISAPAITASSSMRLE